MEDYYEANVSTA